MFENDPKLTMVKRERAGRNVMYAIFLGRIGLVKAIKLEGQNTIILHNYRYTIKCLPEILPDVNVTELASPWQRIFSCGKMDNQISLIKAHQSNRKSPSIPLMLLRVTFGYFFRSPFTFRIRDWWGRKSIFCIDSKKWMDWWF